ncbi:MAG TPA: hypothetical protein VIF43_01595 [Patescibacteria group bacterium]|jgi:hypothetical protein
MAKGKNKGDVSGVAFVGCMFVGLGIGVAFGHSNVGVLVGLGVGFLAMAVLRSQGK